MGVARARCVVKPHNGLGLFLALLKGGPVTDLDKDGKVRISANLSKEVFEALQELSKELGVSMTDVLRRALSTERFLVKEVRNGAKVLLKDQDGSLREIILR